MQLIQVDAGMSGGAEPAVHAVRRLVKNMPDDYIPLTDNFPSHLK